MRLVEIDDRDEVSKMMILLFVFCPPLSPISPLLPELPQIVVVIGPTIDSSFLCNTSKLLLVSDRVMPENTSGEETTECRSHRCVCLLHSDSGQYGWEVVAA